MTNEAFETLVTRLTREAKANPGAYKLRVVLLALLGYVYIFAVLALLIFLTGAFCLWLVSGRGSFLAVKLGLPVAIFAYTILRSLWVRLPPPEGHALTRKQAGPLFQMVDELRQALKTPRIHRILVTDDFNASVTQVPRLGVFGW